MDTPTLVAEFERILPGFSRYLESEENLFDGGTPCAVFSACSHFVRERELGIDAWRPLGEFLNRAVAGSDKAISEAACACFLENLADASHPLKSFLDGEALVFWRRWEPPG